MRKFLRLDNKLILKLKIKPLSPLCIKLSVENSEGSSKNYSAMLTTKGAKIDNDKKGIDCYVRDGEIYIPGSTLKGLFKDRFLTMYGENDKEQFIKSFWI